MVEGLGQKTVAAAREALISAALALALGHGQRDKVRIVLEDVVPALRGLTGADGRILDLARDWLKAPAGGAAAREAETTLRWLCHEKFLHRMAGAHSRFRTPEAASES